MNFYLLKDLISKWPGVWNYGPIKCCHILINKRLLFSGAWNGFCLKSQLYTHCANKSRERCGDLLLGLCKCEIRCFQNLIRIYLWNGFQQPVPTPGMQWMSAFAVCELWRSTRQQPPPPISSGVCTSACLPSSLWLPEVPCYCNDGLFSFLLLSTSYNEQHL